jgi:hypothetical protein
LTVELLALKVVAQLVVTVLMTVTEPMEMALTTAAEPVETALAARGRVAASA